MAIPTLSLASGGSIPVLGLGTFLATKPGEVGAAVKAAIKAGYRLIDCAAGYGNQAEVGAAIKEAIAEGVCTREELFIVSKLFQTHHVWEGDTSRCSESLEKTLTDLQLDYLDLFLIHWPFAFAEKKLEKPEGTPQPLRLPDGTPNPVFTIKMEYLQTWSCMESFVDCGKCKAIGVSNFSAAQLDHLLKSARIPPSVNQIEVHPYFGQLEFIRWCDERKIRVMGYSPLGSAQGKMPPAQSFTLRDHPAVQKAAAAAGKTAAQILIRWGLQRCPTNFISIPKSSNEQRIAENHAVFEWALTAEAMAALDGLESGFRFFMSYFKRPENEVVWHGETIETGTDADLVSSLRPSPA